MLQALLAGKLSSTQENMEDVLTSCVFGSFRYMSHNDGLGVFLKEARGIDRDDRPFSDLWINDAQYDFWPSWELEGLTNCEPDVVLSITDSNNKRWLALIEIKYRSGKSSHAKQGSRAPTDQLAKEWDHLTRRATELGCKPVLIYVTADVIYPASDIGHGSDDYDDHRLNTSAYESFCCFWISWRSLYGMFCGQKGKVASDLRALAEKLGFKEFDGFHGDTKILPMKWAYAHSYNWNTRESGPVDWEYR